MINVITLLEIMKERGFTYRWSFLGVILGRFGCIGPPQLAARSFARWLDPRTRRPRFQ
jgi:hypothetical protein